MRLLYPPAKRAIYDTLMTIWCFLFLLVNIHYIVIGWIKDKMNEWLEKE